jgi:hypothetical protein
MPNITTGIGQYCVFHGYIHNEEYLVCDFCNDGGIFCRHLLTETHEREQFDYPIVGVSDPKMNWYEQGHFRQLFEQ